MPIIQPEIAEILDKKAAPILVVDDDIKMRQGLSQHLKKNNYSVLQASTPEEALDLLNKHNVSILITYHKLSGTSGIDLLIKAREYKPETQRILLGSEMLPEHLVEEIRPVQLMVTQLEHNPDDKTLLQIINNCFDRFKLGFENQAMQTILKQHKNELSNLHSKDKAAFELSSKIHLSLLIDKPPQDLPGVTLYAQACPSQEIDGDFIAFFRPADYLLDISLGDVMGKGLTSALLGTVIRSEIAHYAKPAHSHSFHYDKHLFWHEDLPTLKEILQELHSTIVTRLFSLDYFVSLFYGRLDLKKRTFSFIDCGFTKPIYYRKKSNKAIYINSPNLPLGTVLEQEYSPFEIQYEEGDFFVLYSDGITEAVSPQGELFGEMRLAQIIESNAFEIPDKLSEIIRQNVITFTQKDDLADDLTFILLKIDSLCDLKSENRGIAKFNSVLTQLEAVRALTREICVKAPGNVNQLSSEMQLVVDEIFTNIVIHGYKAQPGFPICIRAEYQKDQLMIEISDQGESLNPHDIPDVNLFGDRDHGYGWYLIRQIADKVTYDPKQNLNGWNHLRLYKNYTFKKEEFMELSSTEKEGNLVILLENESLDAKQVPEFKEKVMKLINEKNSDNIVFDLKKLQFIDSSGLGAFLSLMRQINMRGGKLCLVSMNKPVKTIFELVSMQKIFECYDTVDKAINDKAKK